MFVIQKDWRETIWFVLYKVSYCSYWFIIIFNYFDSSSFLDHRFKLIIYMQGSLFLIGCWLRLNGLELNLGPIVCVNIKSTSCSSRTKSLPESVQEDMLSVLGHSCLTKDDFEPVSHDGESTVIITYQGTYQPKFCGSWHHCLLAAVHTKCTKWWYCI